MSIAKMINRPASLHETSTQATPKGMRLHIAIFGRRNAGKSSLLNAFTRQRVSIVSEMPGTTTDPVEKAMELLPFGPVLFIDTAGVDDTGEIGKLRTEQTSKVLDRTDLALHVVDGDWSEADQTLFAELKKRQIPTLLVRNKIDLPHPDSPALKQFINSTPSLSPLRFSAITNEGIPELREAILSKIPSELLQNRQILQGLISSGDLVLLVVPIDQEAPKGRLIMPQVQVIRDILDSEAMTLVVQDSHIEQALSHLQSEPALVVTDSQVFDRVAQALPPHLPMTGFSILFARFKGDLSTLVEGALTLDQLQPGDHILIAEACSHHPIQDDIGRVKIPQWIKEYCGFDLHFETVSGRDFPENLKDYRLVIHCGACTFNRQLMIQRILTSIDAGVPITNYGLVIAYTLGLFERALQPFPEALRLYQAHTRRLANETEHA